MILAEPGALWLLLLVAILLLLARRQTARVRRSVANLYLWTRTASSPSAQVRFKRIRRHWLLILQAAIVALIVGALARPMLSWRTHPAALIVDITASMAAVDERGTRIEQARRAALNTVEALPRGTRVRLFTAGRVTIDLGEFSRTDPRLAAAVQGLTASAAGGDLARSIRVTRSIFGSTSPITVVSDHIDSTASGADVNWVVVGHAVSNQAISALAARRFPETPHDGQVIATIWNHAAVPVAREVEITQDGQPLSRQRVELTPHSSTTIVADARSIGGIIRARLTGSDALAYDDERATIVPAVERARVLLIGATNFFLERALTTNPNVSVESGGSADVDVAVCDSCTELPTQGRAVLMVRATGKAPALPLSVNLPDHPIAAMLDVGGVTAATADTGVPPGADIVLRAGPHPAVIAYRDGARRIVEMRIELAETGFPLHPAFPVLLDNALGWLSGRGENQTDLSAGEPLRWELKAPPTADEVTIVGPAGRKIELAVNGAMVTATDTAVPGVYTLRSAGSTQTFVVNPASEGESDLSVSGESSQASPSRTHAQSVARIDTAPLLILFALAGLILEWHARVGRARVS